jgi:hypothetical protein
MLENVKEIHFIFFLLRDMGVSIKFPIMVRTDNIGEVFMADNTSFSLRTRRIDTWYYFIRGHVENGFIYIAFVNLEDQTSDMIIKDFNKIT